MKKSGNLYRFLYLFVLVAVFASPLAAQVYVDELGIGTLGPVEFINYEGPHLRIESRDQIHGIGFGLGQAVRTGIFRTGALNRYFVIRSRSDEDGTKLDADIFGLGIDSAVDHIRNLRYIIQGYLEGAYGYSDSDAALLAHYITIYNAVYRGDWEHFSSRYKNDVMSHLTREQAGLAIRFDEWPGRSLIVIPTIPGLEGTLSAIDTSVISDERVTDQMRQDADMGLEMRRDMVDLMEREADEAAQRADISREAIRQEEDRLADERRLAQLQEQQARDEQATISRERLDPDADQRALDDRERDALRLEQEARDRQAQADRDQAALDAQRREAEREQALADQRTLDAQERRQDIAEDQQVIIRQEAQPAAAAGVLAVSIVDSGSRLGRIVRIEAGSGRELVRSPVNTINARTPVVINNRIFAIAGEDRGANTAIRLVEINFNNLEMVKQGDDDISPDSLLWVNGQNLYALINISGSFHLARFNTELVLQARTSTAVHPFASALFSEGSLATQRADGSAVLLDPQSLVERR